MNTDTILHMCEVMLTHSKVTAHKRYESNLSCIRFQINTNLTSCAGRAYYRGEKFGLIEISLPIFERTPCMAELVETILHEIAHIMEPGEHHSMKWVIAAKSIGSTGTRCHSMKKAYTKREKKELADTAVLMSL